MYRMRVLGASCCRSLLPVTFGQVRHPGEYSKNVHYGQTQTICRLVQSERLYLINLSVAHTSSMFVPFFVFSFLLHCVFYVLFSLFQGVSVWTSRDLETETFFWNVSFRLGLEGWTSRSRLGLEGLEKSNVSVSSRSWRYNVSVLVSWL